MPEKMSSSKKAMLKTTASITEKMTSMSIIVAFIGLYVGGKYADLWQIFVPICVISFTLCMWTSGKLPDES